MKTSEILKGLNTDALNKVHGCFANQEIEGMTAMELYVWLHRLEKWAAEIQTNLRPEANKCFTTLQTDKPNQKMWEATEFALVAAMPKPASWTLPAHLLAQEVALREAIANAKAEKTAKLDYAELNPEVQTLFTVQLKAF